MPTAIESARIHPDRHDSLFPSGEVDHGRRSPRDLARELGLNWLAVIAMHEQDWLSYDPETVDLLDRCQEAELLFLGPLAVAGCGIGMMRHMLAGLKKPYCYALNSIYYNWSDQEWHLLEDDDKLESKFEEWLEQIMASSEFGRRESIGSRVTGWAMSR